MTEPDDPFEDAYLTELRAALQRTKPRAGVAPPTEPRPTRVPRPTPPPAEPVEAEVVKTENVASPVVEAAPVEAAPGVEPEAIQDEVLQEGATEPAVVEPETVEPEALEPESVEPEPEQVEPDTEPEALEPETVEPEPEQVEPETEPETVEPEPEQVEPEAAGPEPERAKEPEPEKAEPEKAEPEKAEPEKAEPAVVASEAAERAVVATEAVETEPDLAATGSELVEPTTVEPPSDGPEPDRSSAAPDEAGGLPAKPATDDSTDEPNRSLKSALEWVAVVVGALVVALVVKTFLVQAFYIPSASMEPTLEKGDRVLVNKVSYDLHDVHRGDVIVFELNPEDVGNDGIKDLIKRAIGLPGDVIETRDGVVYVNDRALDEPYLADGMITGDPQDSSNPQIERQTVPDGHVFVLGDNRSNSADSRYPDRGPIPIEDIVGRAFVLVWPPNSISTL